MVVRTQINTRKFARSNCIRGDQESFFGVYFIVRPSEAPRISLFKRSITSPYIETLANVTWLSQCLYFPDTFLVICGVICSTDRSLDICRFHSDFHSEKIPLLGFHGPEEMRSKAASDVHTDLNSVAQRFFTGKIDKNQAYPMHIICTYIYIYIYYTIILSDFESGWLLKVLGCSKRTRTNLRCKRWNKSGVQTEAEKSENTFLEDWLCICLSSLCFICESQSLGCRSLLSVVVMFCLFLDIIFIHAPQQCILCITFDVSTTLSSCWLLELNCENRNRFVNRFL